MQSGFSEHQESSRAPYGKACLSCSRVKCRCIYHAGETGCERCQRLKKECVASNLNRKRIKKTPVSKTAQLEGKLDGIVTLLREQSIVNNSRQTGIPTPQSIIGVSSPLNPSNVLAFAIPDEIAKGQLDIFRQAFLPFFPFFHIPNEMSASDLRLQKPFLWFVIMSLTTKSGAQQLAMGDIILQFISEKLVCEHERSLDILLGLLCYLAWFQYHKKNKPYLVMWTQLAVGLVFELGIHRSDSREVGQFSSKADWFPPRIPTGPVRSMEGRRAILGVFIISSMVWTSLRQMEPLRWTPYMDDCVNVLRKEMETELDFLLILQAKCFVTVDQITLPSTSWISDSEGSGPPAAFLIKALQMQLQDLRQSLPDEMQSKRTALLSLYGTEIIGKEALLHKPKTRDQTQDQTDLRRLEGLEQLLAAIEHWFEIFHQIPLTIFSGISFALFCQFSHNLILLFKLSTLEDPGWDIDDVRKRVDLCEMLELLAQKLESLGEAMGIVNDSTTGEISAPFKAAPLIRGMKAKFSAELRPDVAQGEEEGAFVFPENWDASFADDPWLMDMFNSLGEF